TCSHRPVGRQGEAVKATAARIHSPVFAAPTFDSARLLSQPLFRDALARERRRADRFEHAFVLILISLHRASSQSRSEHLLEALSQTKFDADILGWYEQGSVIGLIRTLGETETENTAVGLAH